jgi:hypothetical protein
VAVVIVKATWREHKASEDAEDRRVGASTIQTDERHINERRLIDD